MRIKENVENKAIDDCQEAKRKKEKGVATGSSNEHKGEFKLHLLMSSRFSPYYPIEDSVPKEELISEMDGFSGFQTMRLREALK